MKSEKKKEKEKKKWLSRNRARTAREKSISFRGIVVHRRICSGKSIRLIERVATLVLFFSFFSFFYFFISLFLYFFHPLPFFFFCFQFSPLCRSRYRSVPVHGNPSSRKYTRGMQDWLGNGLDMFIDILKCRSPVFGCIVSYREGREQEKERERGHVTPQQSITL